jgi:hypothetical protein
MVKFFQFLTIYLLFYIKGINPFSKDININYIQFLSYINVKDSLLLILNINTSIVR